MKGLRENYYRPKDDAVLVGVASPDGKIRKPGYVDLMRELVISDEERAKVKVKELQKKITGEQALKSRIERLEMLLPPAAKELDEKFGDSGPLKGQFSPPTQAEDEEQEPDSKN